MKAPVTQVLLQTSLLILQFSKICLKTLSQIFMNGRTCRFCVISFKCSINQSHEYCILTKVLAARFMNNFIFVLWRMSMLKFLIIFCYIEVLFPGHSESNRTHIFLEQAVRSLSKTFFQKYSERNFQEDKYSGPKSKQYFWKKMSVM